MHLLSGGRLLVFRDRYLVNDLFFLRKCNRDFGRNGVRLIIAVGCIC